MKINVNKSKLTIISKEERSNEEKIKINLEEMELTTVYEYHGSVITNDEKIIMDIPKKVRKIENFMLVRIRYSSREKIDRNIKLKLYNCITKPILTYARYNS